MDENACYLITLKGRTGRSNHLMKVFAIANLSRALAAENDGFRWSEVRRGILEPQMWLSASAYFAILSGLYSFGLFV